MKIFILKTKKAGDIKAFEIIKKQVVKKPDLLIGFAVGKTTDNLYKLISNDAIKNPKIWKKIKVFQIDENLGIPPSSPLSFNYEIRKELKGLFKIVYPKNIFLFDGLKKPKTTIKEAYQFIRANKGIDLIVLGLGGKYDPHIAYNTTGKSTLNSKLRVVDLHPKTVEKLVNNGFGKGKHNHIPTKGITLGIRDILKAKKTLLIAYGKEKAKSVQLITNGKIDMKKASASALILHKNLEIIIDKEAGERVCFWMIIM